MQTMRAPAIRTITILLPPSTLLFTFFISLLSSPRLATATQTIIHQSIAPTSPISSQSTCHPQKLSTPTTWTDAAISATAPSNLRMRSGNTAAPQHHTHGASPASGHLSTKTQRQTIFETRPITGSKREHILAMRAIASPGSGRRLRGPRIGRLFIIIARFALRRRLRWRRLRRIDAKCIFSVLFAR